MATPSRINDDIHYHSSHQSKQRSDHLPAEYIRMKRMSGSGSSAAAGPSPDPPSLSWSPTTAAMDGPSNRRKKRRSSDTEEEPEDHVPLVPRRYNAQQPIQTNPPSGIPSGTAAPRLRGDAPSSRSAWRACARSFARQLGIWFLNRKPQKFPRQFPFPNRKTTTEATASRHRILEDGEREATSSGAHAKFPANVVRNQKYNPVSFLPLILFEQFKFFFNLYFLLVALSQLIPSLQIGYLFTYFAPLAFVLLVTITKEALDDYKRFRRDQEANAQKYRKITADGLFDIPSSKIQVGDIILVQKNQRVPADMILLRTSEKSGGCFIRTDQLDGETDWKLRLAIPSLQQLPEDMDVVHVEGLVFADRPHKDIYDFVGNFRTFLPGQPDRVEPLSVENTLWMNTVVASGTAIGCVVYTGEETRAVMNTSTPGTKVGQLDLELNRLSKILFVVLLTLSFVLIALNRFQGLWYVYLMRFLIIFSSIIPLSLRVNLDLAKTYYSYLMMNDGQVPNTIVRTSTIPEELGRIEYLLSDKTGTLTKNDMELKKLHMGTMSYGLESVEDLRRNLESHFAESGSLRTHVARPSTSGGVSMVKSRHRDISTRISETVQALALCHNVTPVIEEIAPRTRARTVTIGIPDATRPSGITYQASSPDEVAIVKWTELVGLALVFRDMTSIRLQFTSISGENDTAFEFDILHVFPFTSETKRMGIIVRERRTGEIIFYMKGADAVMAKIVQYNDWLEEECGNMAREGLRTLVVARKKLSVENLQEFEQKYQHYQAFSVQTMLRRYHEVKISIADRNAKMQECIATMLENDLELLGLTGVEDKLQDEVKTTLEILRNAGLKIWMLTGDKIETATNIAISSKLVARNQSIYHIQRIPGISEARDELDRLDMQSTDCCLVVDGNSLQVFMDHFEEEFVQTAVRLPAVVCCRCSPTQKAAITSLIRKHTRKHVCAIGDGGNDVSMIQAANVGVGIVGKEGKQASLAADFSVTQFSHLTRLLLWHGRNNYKRSAKLSQFIIHRGLIISIMQAVFSAIFYFAPIALYQGMMMVGYSTVYTMIPVFSLVLDKDISEDIALLYPELYKDLPKGRSLSMRTFFTWLLISLYQGGVIMMLALWLFEDEFRHIVSITFTALVFNELIMVALEIITWHRLMIYSEVATIAIYLGSMVFLETEFGIAY